jgi:DNA-binding response OmpR family regulator
MNSMTSVLVIEDEETLARNLADKLGSEGYTVHTTYDGETGLRLAQENIPDLLILDILLPGLDGLSICRVVRGEASTADIPIIMLTARGMEVDKIVGLESGADDYIVKPVGLGEILARVRALLRRGPRRPALQDQIVSEDLQLSQMSRRVLRNGDEICLSHKEFDLLAELMRNKGIVLSRDLILAKVWGYDYFVDKRTVDVHVRWLRKKIEDDPSNPMRIVTVRGVGYRFEG